MAIGQFLDSTVREILITLDSYNDLMYYKTFYDMAINGKHDNCQKIWQAEWNRQNEESEEK